MSQQSVVAESKVQRAGSPDQNSEACYKCIPVYQYGSITVIRPVPEKREVIKPPVFISRPN